MSRDRRLRAIGLLAVALALACLVGACQEPAPAPPEPPPTEPPAPEVIEPPAAEMVIVSDLGEVTHDVRYLGDRIRYRIYCRNVSEQSLDVVIVDELDPGLGEVVVLDGDYDVRGHVATWKLEGVAPLGTEMVELEAVLADSEVIRNQAVLLVEGQREVPTNVVETLNCPRPQLGWVPFDGVSKPGTIPHAFLKEETTTGTMLRFQVPGMFVHEVEIEGTRYHRLSIPGRAALTDVGKPELPIVGEVIEVPHDVKFTVDVVSSDFVELPCYNVYPAQPPEIDQQPEREPFTIDRATYLRDGDYPGELAVVHPEDIGIIRGRRLVFLKLQPLQYNPVTKMIRAYKDVEVRVEFDHPAQITAIKDRLLSPAFDELLQATALNYHDTQRFFLEDNPGHNDEEQGCDYLIITHGDFYTATVDFADWKRSKGYLTRIVDVANIPGGPTQDNIRDYIDDAYDNWNPVPTYVLLVGDADLVPTFRHTGILHGSHGNTQIGSDLHYATVDGSDFFPDLFVGRLPVETLAEAEAVIDKILDYEQSPPATPANAGYYRNVSLIALFEDDTDPPDAAGTPDPEPEDGVEDRPWIECVEEIREHLRAAPLNYTVERIYNTSAWATNPISYENGTILPADLRVANGFMWNGGTADIRNAINNGRFLVTFRDHGWQDSWSEPTFTNANVAALTNNDLQTVAFSIACRTGWFDNETDDAALGTAANDESFCEHFLLQDNNRGAAAIIGATRNSQTGYNDFLMFGFHKALWPDFEPNPPITGYPQEPDIETGPLLRMGQIHTFGKVYMASAYGPSNDRNKHFAIYHLFGDPEMPAWTEAPDRLSVQHPVGIGATGTQDFVVKVTDDDSGDAVHMATATLKQGGTLLGVRQTDWGGIARYTLSLSSATELDLTVTAQGYQPYTATMEVVAGGAHLNRLQPEDGTEGQVIHVGGQNLQANEPVDLYLDGALVQNTNADAAGAFGQVGHDVDITVPLGSELGPVNVLAEGTHSGRYAVDVFQVRSANPIDLYTYDQWDNTTWHLHAGDNPVWNNPEIQLYDMAGNPVQSNNLTAGITYTIRATVYNDTDFDARQVKVSFKWANFGLGQPDRVWFAVDADGAVEINVNRRSHADAEVRWAPPSTGHLCLMVEIYHVEDINTSNNRGQENCHVGPTSSPAEVRFLVWNPTDGPAMVHLELRQIRRPVQEEQPRLWPAYIRQPDPQLIGPGEEREAWVIIDPQAADIRQGEEAEFALTGYIRGKMIGGVNFIIINK